MQIDKIVTTTFFEAPELVEVPIRGANYLTTMWFSIVPMENNWYKVTELDSGESMIFPGADHITYLLPDVDATTEVELFLAAVNAGILPEENV
jgi:hypothetical protein